MSPSAAVGENARSTAVDGADPPIARFGEHVLRSDPSHPDAAGHEVVARALADAIAAQPGFRALRGRVAPSAYGSAAGSAEDGISAR